MIKLTMTGDRRVTKIEADGFAITLNGRTNQEYKAALAPLGVELVFVEEKVEVDVIPCKPATPPNMTGIDPMNYS